MSSGLIMPSQSSFDDFIDDLGSAARLGTAMTKTAWAGFCDEAENVFDSLVDCLDDLFSPPVAAPVVTSEPTLQLEPVEALKERELRRVLDSADAVRTVLGASPVVRLQSLDPAERMRILLQLTDDVSAALKVAPIGFAVRRLKIGDRHASFMDERYVCIDCDLVMARPMSETQACMVLMGLLHELYHVFEHDAAEDPKRYGISARLAKTWRDEFNDYIPFDLNARRNEDQKMELAARHFSVSVLEAAL